MDSTMNVKITDLGFATQVENDQSLYDLFGTPGKILFVFFISNYRLLYVGYMAPELLRCSQDDGAPGYGRPVDLWACGVILYTLLSGLPPFWHRKQHLMFRMIVQGQYSLAGSEWDDVSETAKDLIHHLLVVNPVDRFTAAQALQHPFFANERAKRRDFMAKRTLKAHLILVWSIHRLRTLHYRPQPIRGKELLGNEQIVKTMFSFILYF